MDRAKDKLAHISIARNIYLSRRCQLIFLQKYYIHSEIEFLIFLFQIRVYSRCLFTLFLSTCLRVFSILIYLTHTLTIYTKNKLGIVNLQRIKDRFSDDT